MNRFLERILKEQERPQVKITKKLIPIIYITIMFSSLKTNADESTPKNIDVWCQYSSVKMKSKSGIEKHVGDCNCDDPDFNEKHNSPASKMKELKKYKIQHERKDSSGKIIEVSLKYAYHTGVFGFGNYDYESFFFRTEKDCEEKQKVDFEKLQKETKSQNKKYESYE